MDESNLLDKNITEFDLMLIAVNKAEAKSGIDIIGNEFARNRHASQTYDADGEIRYRVQLMDVVHHDQRHKNALILLFTEYERLRDLQRRAKVEQALFWARKHHPIEAAEDQ